MGNINLVPVLCRESRVIESRVVESRVVEVEL